MKSLVVVLILSLLAGPVQSVSMRSWIRESRAELSPPMHPKLLSLAALDMRYAIGALQWLKSIAVVGDNTKNSDFDSLRLNWIWDSLKSQLFLDPFGLDTYVMAASLFILKGQPVQALQSQTYGAIYRTRDWRILMNLGYLLSARYGEGRRAALAYKLGSNMPDSPGWMAGLSAMHLVNNGKEMEALAFLETQTLGQYRGDDVLMNELINMRDTLRLLLAIRDLLPEYYARFNRSAHSFEDLINAGMLRGIPVDAFGEALLWDDKTNSPVSTARLTPFVEIEGENEFRDDWMDVANAKDLFSPAWPKHVGVVQ